MDVVTTQNPHHRKTGIADVTIEGNGDGPNVGTLRAEIAIRVWRPAPDKNVQPNAVPDNKRARSRFL
jgi:hypothetical protein